MSLSWALSPTPTRNYEITVIVGLYRPLLPPKFETAMTTGMAVMVAWGHEGADFYCASFHQMFRGLC